jgi:rRNA-processing protein EBP2
MVTKSKLRLALAAEKGVDFQKLKQKRKHKDAVRRKRLDGGVPLEEPGSDAEKDDVEDAEDGEAEADEVVEEIGSDAEEEESDEEESTGFGVRSHTLPHRLFVAVLTFVAYSLTWMQ